jgi:hypothetical protein
MVSAYLEQNRMKSSSIPLNSIQKSQVDGLGKATRHKHIFSFMILASFPTNLHLAIKPASAPSLHNLNLGTGELAGIEDVERSLNRS